MFTTGWSIERSRFQAGYHFLKNFTLKGQLFTKKAFSDANGSDLIEI